MEIPTNKRFVDLTGKRFGRIIVISFAGNRQWNCLCDCGNETTVWSSQLLIGKTNSCGCLRKELASAKFKKHGKSQTSEYKIWKDIKKRCYNIKNKEFHNYGGRGIKVCDRWINNFENFLADMGERPNPSLSIDRKDTNGHYEPDNCRWATATQQAENKRNNRVINYQGKPMVLRDVANLSGIHFTTIIKRLDAGWSVEDAISIKPRHKQHITQKGN